MNRTTLCRSLRVVIPAWSLILALAAHALDVPAEPLDRFPRGILKIATTDARVHTFNVWIATTEQRREQGLMFVKSMPDDAGMLFVYSTPRPISMWMKNTVIPLDMVFIRADGRVARVVHDAHPQSLKVISSGENVLGVLELNAGTAAKLNVVPGAIVSYTQATEH